jgi:protein-S-isoprenylcysteine O-methyltransferase Ste14
MNKKPAPWWHGSRGEWYVAGQFMLVVLVFFGPRHYAGWNLWPFPFPAFCIIAGSGLLLLGIVVFVAGIFRLGSNLSPLPYPKEHAQFIEAGPYRFVRHPIYSGGAAIAFGWSLIVGSWFTLFYALILLVFLDRKATREERWLEERFPGYSGYKRRVRKLLPFIY